MSLESLEGSVKALQELLIQENKRKHEFEKEISQLKTRLETLENFVKEKIGYLPENAEEEEEEEEESSEDEQLLKIDFTKKKFIKEGFLAKKSDLRNAWKERWFRLYSEGPLFYFEEEKDTEPSGIIHLKGARLYPHTQKNGIIDPLMFAIKYGNSTFLLSAHTLEEKEEWLKVIKENISGEAEDGENAQPVGSIYKTKVKSSTVEVTNEEPDASYKKKSSKKKTESIELIELEEADHKSKSPKKRREQEEE